MLAFICIGAQKAGTTWLHRQLSGHPDVWFENSRKEFHYWDRFERGGTTEGIDSYVKRFGAENVVSGDITPSYATLLPTTIAQIAATNPKLKLIFILRDPVLRAWSAARMFMRNAWIECEDVSGQWLQELCCCPSFTARGYYAETLRRWFSYFPSEAFLILDYSRIAMEPHEVLAEVADHLELSDGFRSKSQSAVSDVVFSGQEWPIPNDVKQKLITHYKERSRELEDLLQGTIHASSVETRRWLR